MISFIRHFWRGSAVAATVALLAGCGAAVPLAQAPAGQAVSNGLGSWRAAGLEHTDLLYVDDSGDDRITIFTFPQGKAVGEIDGAPRSDGLCSDKHGHVFVPGYDQTEIFEFAHGKTQPIAMLKLMNYVYPGSCAVDPLTGNLAVTTDTGRVAIFPDAKNPPQYYDPGGAYNVWHYTYDDSGNLFAGGDEADGEFVLSELPRGSYTMNAIDVPAEISPELPLLWDGKHLAIEAEQDFHATILLRVSVSGSRATVVGKTKLAGSPNGIGTEFWFAGGYAVQPENGNTGVGFWKYPAGGKAVTNLQNLGTNVFGVTVSYGRKKQ